MLIIKYTKKDHKQIITECVAALKAGKTVVYPTDTSYGIACDITNPKARARFYKIKERTPKKPVHVIVPSLAYAKKIADWNTTANKLVKAFWPGPFSIVLPQKKKITGLGHSADYLKVVSAGTGTVGLRNPDQKVAQDLARVLGRPIPATSANPSLHLSGGYDSYSADDVITQFGRQKYKPDIIIDAGKLPKRKPSTFVKITDDGYDILRLGPISKKKIETVLKK